MTTGHLITVFPIGISIILGATRHILEGSQDFPGFGLIGDRREARSDTPDRAPESHKQGPRCYARSESWSWFCQALLHVAGADRIDLDVSVEKQQ
jgi:hypothetical protein